MFFSSGPICAAFRSTIECPGEMRETASIPLSLSRYWALLRRDNIRWFPKFSMWPVCCNIALHVCPHPGSR